ncbi:MAG: hypothetical protein EOP49_02050 [Sphingobacteriales bacterium]|nr:MAG: hypothetical protein EOP49_02050 [Sphingobacteriales bacterium]
MRTRCTYGSVFKSRCRLIIVLLALIFAWNLSGFTVWQHIRNVHYMAQQVKQSPLRDTVRITSAALARLQYVKHDEVLINGNMFDIKKTISLGTDVLLVGHYDERDDQLFRWLDRLFDQHGKKNKGKCLTWHFDCLPVCMELRQLAAETPPVIAYGNRPQELIPFETAPDAPPPKASAHTQV